MPRMIALAAFIDANGPTDAEAAGDTLRFIFANPSFLPGRDWRLTLVRVE